MYLDDKPTIKSDEIDCEVLAREFNELIEAGEVTDVYDYGFEKGLTAKAIEKLVRFL